MNQITRPVAVLGFHFHSQRKKMELPMELNPGYGVKLAGYLQKSKRRCKETTE